MWWGMAGADRRPTRDYNTKEGKKTADTNDEMAKKRTTENQRNKINNRRRTRASVASLASRLCGVWLRFLRQCDEIDVLSIPHFSADLVYLSVKSISIRSFRQNVESPLVRANHNSILFPRP